MKVIKRGQKPEERIYRATCNNCKSVLEFTAGEAKYNSDQRDGDFSSVDCPVCGSNVTVQTSQVWTGDQSSPMK